MIGSGEIGPVCLVTGGLGFFGRALVRRLVQEGLRVRVLDVARGTASDPSVEYVEGDLRHPDTVMRAADGVSTVFHTAAVIHLGGVASEATRKRVHDVNVGGTENVIAACRQQGVGQLVYTSSNNVVFDREIVLGDETEPYAERAFDLYTITKRESEKRVLAAGKEGALKTCSLRPGGIWAPYPGGVMIDKVVEQLAKGTFVARIGEGASSDNTHVENLAEAQLLAARALIAKPQLVSGQAYFITDDEPMDTVEWFRPLVEALGYVMPERRIPENFMYGLAYGMEWADRLFGTPALVTRLEVLKVTRTHTFRIDKARADLGYEPRIKRDSGLLDCVPFAKELIAQRKGRPISAKAV
jgi:3beta-hydroxy-delta5-steroid dehydrogenase/steroid delta-isomerase